MSPVLQLSHDLTTVPNPAGAGDQAIDHAVDADGSSGDRLSCRRNAVVRTTVNASVRPLDHHLIAFCDHVVDLDEIVGESLHVSLVAAADGVLKLRRDQFVEDVEISSIELVDVPADDGL